MKQLDSQISVYINREDETVEIKINDSGAKVKFFEANIPYKDFINALSGWAYIPIDVTLSNLDKIGKKQIQKTYSFPIDPSWDYHSMKKLAYEKCLECLKNDGMSDWTPDTYFGSQNSFSTDRTIATAIIRRWE